MEIAPELVKPTGAVETDAVDDHRAPPPVSDRLPVPGPIQILEVGVFSAIGRNHAVAGLSRNQAALPRVNEDQVVRCLGDVRRDADTRNSGGHALIGGIFFVGVRVEILHSLPVFRFIKWAIRSHSSQESGGSVGLLGIFSLTVL